MRKLSQRQVILKKLSKRAKPDVEQFILDMRDHVKNDPIIIKKFKEYSVPLDEIDNVPIEFCDLDVSAKTKNQKIYLNEAMLDDDSEVKDPTHYLVHELIHFLQQRTNNSSEGDNKDYLDKETEEEAFKSQIDFKRREESPEEAEEYVEKLLDHHDVSGKKRKEKKEELLDK